MQNPCKHLATGTNLLHYESVRVGVLSTTYYLMYALHKVNMYKTITHMTTAECDRMYTPYMSLLVLFNTSSSPHSVN